MTRGVLFVCTGNTCRSPMAEGFFKLEAGRRELKIEARSCGLAPNEGERASIFAIRAAMSRGADISAHRAKKVSKELVSGAERVYTMTSSQANALKSAYPMYADRILTLSGYDISDPYGGGEAEYERAAGEILSAVKRIAGEL